MGKKRIIAETGAGQHGVATATVAARAWAGVRDLHGRGGHGAAGAECRADEVSWARRWCAVTAGQATLKEAINEAMRDWVTNVRTTHYILGSALGSHPYPMMVRDFHRVIGDEARRQILEREGRLPDLLIACVGGGSNAIGLFWPFLEDEAVKHDRRRSRRRRHPQRRTRRAFPRRQARRAARHEDLSARRRRRPDRAHPFRLAPASTTPPSGRSTRYLRDQGRIDYDLRHRRRSARRLPAALARPKASSPRSRPRTPSPM